jgi:hypothetical protein
MLLDGVPNSLIFKPFKHNFLFYFLCYFKNEVVFKITTKSKFKIDQSQVKILILKVTLFLDG